MKDERILCVDDDKITLMSFERELGQDFQLTTAESGEEALEILKTRGPFGVIMADMLMPGMNGIELLGHAQRIAPDTVRVMLTGDEEKETAVEAINEGRIFRFLYKPCDSEKLIQALRASLEQHRLIQAERELLEKTLNGSVKMLSELLSLSEPHAFVRGQKVCEYVRAVAPSLSLAQTWDVEVAAMLAQVGKMSIPPTVMEKMRIGVALTDREKEMVTRIPEIGYMVLSKIPRLEPAARIVLFQNKNFDGTGFPKDYKNIEFPKGARILRILGDLVDMEAKGVGRKSCLDQMKIKKGVYDMAVFEALHACLVTQESTAKGSALPLKEVAAGDELLANVETLDGRLIAPTGTVISPMLLERLHNFAEISGIKEPLYVRHKM